MRTSWFLWPLCGGVVCLFLLSAGSPKVAGQSGSRGLGRGITAGGRGTPGGGGSFGGGGLDGIDALTSAAELANWLAATDAARRNGRQAAVDARLLQFLRESKYRNWAPFPGANPGDLLLRHPHGTHQETYVNRVAAADPEGLPPGAIIVQENFQKDQRKLVDVTVMCRLTGFDPEHGDWYWVKFRPDGTVVRDGETRLSGKVVSCIECHGRAAGGDFVFSND